MADFATEMVKCVKEIAKHVTGNAEVVCPHVVNGANGCAQVR